MATSESVVEQFQFLGIEIAGPVLTKCVEMCKEYKIDPETFVEHWMAFSLSNLNGGGPTLDRLQQLERREFQKDIDVSWQRDRERAGGGALVDVINIPCDSDYVSDYIQTPQRKKPQDDSMDISVEMSPAPNSQLNQPGKYSMRTNAGVVLLSHGNEEMLDNFKVHSDLYGANSIVVQQLPNEDGEIFASKVMFGFELLHDKAAIYDNHIKYLAANITKKHNIKQTLSVRYKTQIPVYVAGRIECDADARLNPQSVLLQGTWEESLSQSVPLDLSQLKEYSLFPGQVVVVKGMNPRGDRFIAEEIYNDAALPVCNRLIDETPYKGILSVVCCRGPYTTSESLQYEGLKDVISYTDKNKPNVLLLIGPFIQQHNAEMLSETYKSYYEKLLDTIDEISIVSPHTKVIIQSSSEDVFNVNIYPTPSYNTKRKHPNTSFIPDPCMLNINGVIFMTTSTDVLMLLGKEEISSGMSGDKLSRLASHLLSQRTSLPLYAVSNMSIDANVWNINAQFTITPHIMVLPSQLRYNVKDVNGTMIVNPERLIKGSGGGTFAHINIKCDDTTLDVAQNTAVKIIRI